MGQSWYPGRKLSQRDGYFWIYSEEKWSLRFILAKDMEFTENLTQNLSFHPWAFCVMK